MSFRANGNILISAGVIVKRIFPTDGDWSLRCTLEEVQENQQAAAIFVSRGHFSPTPFSLQIS
jgi:hypothetical protein